MLSQASPLPAGKLVVVYTLNPLPSRKCETGGRSLSEQVLKLDFGVDILTGGERVVLVTRDLSQQGRAAPVVPSRLTSVPAQCPRTLLFRPGIPRRWHSAQQLRADGRAGIAENRFAGAAGAFSSSLLPWSLISCPSFIVHFPPPSSLDVSLFLSL